MLRCLDPVRKGSTHSISWNTEPVFSDSYHLIVHLGHQDAEQKIIPLQSSIRRGFKTEGCEMDFKQRRILGRTGLSVGCLGIACSYGAPTEAYEEAFERGVNYFYWGSMRKKSMAQAIRNIIKKGKRDELVIVIQSYSRSAVLLESFFRKGLRTLGIDTADVLLLGWFNERPSSRVMERVLAMREKGMFRFLGLSGHNRSLFPRLAERLGV